MVALRWTGSATVKPVATIGGGLKGRALRRRPSPDTGKPMQLKGECMAALTEVPIGNCSPGWGPSYPLILSIWNRRYA